MNERLLYNSRDNYSTRRVFDVIYPQLDEDTRRVYEAFMGLQGVCFAVQLRGICVDLDVRRELLQDFEAQMEAKRAEVRALAGDVFGGEDGVSTKKLGIWFYETLGLKEQLGFKTGSRTTDEDALNRLAKRSVPVAADVPNPEKTKRKDAAATVSKLILEIRDLSKQASALADILLERGRMRTTLRVAGTESFRLAAGKTWQDRGHNQQNVDKRLKRCFVPDPGFVFIGQDQERAESMTVAYCSGDEAYIKAHEGNTHVIVARALWPDMAWTGDEDKDKMLTKGIRLPDLGNATLYDTSKRVQHGLNYLLTPHGLAHHAGMTVARAEDVYDKYFGMFPGILRWHQEVIDELQNTGVVTCPGGIKRIFFGRRWDKGTHREAISFIPQAVIGWSNHLAMFRLYHQLESDEFNVLAHVHDHVLMQVRKEKVDLYLPQVVKLSEIVWPIRGRTMAIRWERQTGTNWAEA